MHQSDGISRRALLGRVRWCDLAGRLLRHQLHEPRERGAARAARIEKHQSKWWRIAALLLWALAEIAHAGNVTYVYTDPQGTPLAEADSHGNITARFDYRPYGGIALGAAPDGPGYTGHVNDPDTGFVYMQARYYDPTTGRFISPDLIGSTPSNIYNFSRYAYAYNNPINHDDPSGQCPDKNPCFEPTPYNFFRDNFIGGVIGHAVGDTIAVFRSDSINPLTHEALDRGQLQDAKLSMLMMAAPAPSRAEKAAAEVLRPMARGVASEARVLLELGLTKNTRAVSTVEGRAIPDALTSTTSYEIKDTANVYATRQVRIQTDADRAAGRQSVLITGKNTNVSAPATTRYDRIIRRDDLGPRR